MSDGQRRGRRRTQPAGKQQDGGERENLCGKPRHLEERRKDLSTVATIVHLEECSPQATGKPEYSEGYKVYFENYIGRCGNGGYFRRSGRRLGREMGTGVQHMNSTSRSWRLRMSSTTGQLRHYYGGEIAQSVNDAASRWANWQAWMLRRRRYRGQYANHGRKRTDRVWEPVSSASIPTSQRARHSHSRRKRHLNDRFSATQIAKSMQTDGTGTPLKVFEAVNNLRTLRKVHAQYPVWTVGH